MEHHGGTINPDGWIITESKRAVHLTYDDRCKRYPSVPPYTMRWDSDGIGAIVWFDTIEEAFKFIRGKRLGPLCVPAPIDMAFSKERISHYNLSIAN